MAPLYPLEDNVNTTEECRYNLDLTLDSLFGLYNGNTMLNDVLSISSLALQPDHKLINNGTNTPLVDIVSSCKNYSIINSPLYIKYPMYLYYTYCGYSRFGESVEPCIAYTSNTTFVNKLNIDKQFFDYINFNFTAKTINDLNAGIATYKFKQSERIDLNSNLNVFYNVFNPTDWTAAWCPGKGKEGNFYFEENSYTPPSIDSSRAKAACKCTSNSNKDLLIRFPYYPCSILYKQRSDEAILYSPMNPIREIFTTQNEDRTNLPNIANTDNLSSFSKLLVQNNYWKKDYISADITDIIVCTQVPEDGRPAVATYFDYISSASDIANAVKTGDDKVQPFKFDSRYFNNTSDNKYTTATSSAQLWGSDKDYKKDMPYCQVSSQLTYKKDGNTIKRLAYIPPILSPARIKDAKAAGKNYKCSIYYTGSGKLGGLFETLCCTPLARRQPVLVIDDNGLFEQYYSYALSADNRATNTKMAIKLNNIALHNNNLPFSSYTKNRKTYILNKGTYALVLIGSGGCACLYSPGSTQKRWNTGGAAACIQLKITLKEAVRLTAYVGNSNNGYSSATDGSAGMYYDTRKTYVEIQSLNNYNTIILCTAEGGGDGANYHSPQGIGGKGFILEDHNLPDYITIDSYVIDNGENGTTDILGNSYSAAVSVYSALKSHKLLDAETGESLYTITTDGASPGYHHLDGFTVDYNNNSGLFYISTNIDNYISE